MDAFGQRIDEQTVQFVRILPGPIERIWDYLWEGKKRSEWWAAGAMPTRPGESFGMYTKHSTLSPNQALPPDRLVELDKTGHHLRNVLLACEPPRRLLFTLGPSARADDDSELEFLLSQEGDAKDDKVRLTLNHRKIPNRQYAVDAAGGWHAYLTILQHKVEGKIPPAFWDVFRQTDGVYEKRYR